jgi:gamma-glutamylaminecyclotransferase
VTVLSHGVATIVANMTAVQRIFVFGTLQEGHRNFHINRGRRVGGDWVTAQPLPLYVIGPYRLPWLLNRPGQGVPVIGEVYEVDDAALADMDRLERLDDPLWYERRRIAVRPLDAPASVPAEEVWVYFGSEAGFADQTVHTGPIDQYTLSMAAQHPLRMP